MARTYQTVLQHYNMLNTLYVCSSKYHECALLNLLSVFFF